MRLLLCSAWSGVHTFEYPKSQILIRGRGELSISTFSSLMSLFATPYTMHKLMTGPSRLCLSCCSMASACGAQTNSCREYKHSFHISLYKGLTMRGQ